MGVTSNLGLPYIAAAQAQKHVTHNDAIRALDAIIQLSLKARDINDPPASPSAGDRYFVGAAPTGDWAGRPGQIAAWQDDVWTFFIPQAGWIAWVEAEAAVLAWDGAAWQSFGGASINPAPLVGVNATADTTNRLSVSSPASLFNHEGNGHQQKINKAAAGDTASQLYQTGFSGRAEIGLTGDDDFHFKVSPDGTAFKEAIIIDRTTAVVSFPFTTFGAGGGGTGPNILVNGDFQLNQRAFAGGALTAGAYGFDRFKAATGGANVSLSGFTVTLASGELEQIIEPGLWGYADFASLEVTVSVEAPSQDLTVTFGAQSGTITAGSGRRTVTLTLGGGETGDLSFKIKRAAAGSVTFARIKLEVGASATDWQARPASLEALLALRYYWTTYEPGTAPGTITEAGSVLARDYASGGGTLHYNWLATRFPALMRATPAITWYSPDSGTSGKVWNKSSDIDDTVSSTTATGVGASGYPIMTGASAANASLYSAHITADAEI